MEILHYLTRVAGAQIARKYDQKFAALYERLKDFPGVGAPRPALGTGRRITTVLPYVVIYEIRGETVRILRLVHGRRRITAAMLID